MHIFFLLHHCYELMMLFRITEITRFELLRFQNNKQKLTNLAVTLPNLRVMTSTKIHGITYAQQLHPVNKFQCPKGLTL